MGKNVAKLVVSDLLSVPAKDCDGGGRANVWDAAFAEPLEQTLKVLDQARAIGLATVYPLFVFDRLQAIGSSADLNWHRNLAGEFEEQLLIGCPCDDHMEARRERIDAICDHMRATPGGREALVEYLNRCGWFVDNRPFASPEATIDEVLSAGIRLMINLDGALEHQVAGGAELIDCELSRGFPLKRAVQRLGASCRQRGWRDQIIAIVRNRGTLHAGSGWTVLEGASPRPLAA